MLTVVYLLAHWDDEYAAFPAIARFSRRGARQVFIYLTRSPGVMEQRRRAETERFLQFACRADRPCEVVALGAAGAIEDGQLWVRARSIAPRLKPLLKNLSPQLIVTPAWEGGHPDHDLCAALAVHCAPPGARILQFGLYNGARLPGPFFRGGQPIVGRRRGLRLDLSTALRFAKAVLYYPSQLPVWSTLWPALWWRYLRSGYALADLARQDVLRRPHRGPLLYERRGRATYAQIAATVAMLGEIAPGATFAPDQVDAIETGQDDVAR